MNQRNKQVACSDIADDGDDTYHPIPQHYFARAVVPSSRLHWVHITSYLLGPGSIMVRQPNRMLRSRLCCHRVDRNHEVWTWRQIRVEY